MGLRSRGIRCINHGCCCIKYLARSVQQSEILCYPFKYIKTTVGWLLVNGDSREQYEANSDSPYISVSSIVFPSGRIVCYRRSLIWWKIIEQQVIYLLCLVFL